MCELVVARTVGMVVTTSTEPLEYEPAIRHGGEVDVAPQPSRLRPTVRADPPVCAKAPEARRETKFSTFNHRRPVRP